MTYTIFLSHSSKDTSLLPFIQQAAEAAGASMFIAEHEVTPGVDLTKKIQQNLESSKAVIWLVTPNSRSSQIVQQEIGFALARKKIVIPIVVGNVIPEGMTLDIEYIRLDPLAPKATLNRLSNYIKDLAMKDRNATLIGLGAFVLGAFALYYCSREEDANEGSDK